MLVLAWVGGARARIVSRWVPQMDPEQQVSMVLRTMGCPVRCGANDAPPLAIHMRAKVASSTGMCPYKLELAYDTRSLLLRQVFVLWAW